MAKIGRFISDPKAGAYCRITLETGEKIVVGHDQGGFKGGWIIIERPKLMGLTSDRIFACHLDSVEGKTALSFLTRETQGRSLEATPLGAFVKYLSTCHSIDEVRARCTALMAIHRVSDR